jgi:hypothetical protein
VWKSLKLLRRYWTRLEASMLKLLLKEKRGWIERILQQEKMVGRKRNRGKR